MPNVAGFVARDLDETWCLRRRKYMSLLAEPGAFVLIAQDADQLLGYAMVRPSEGSIGYTTGSAVGEVETLSVIPTARGRGVGTALMDAVDRELVAVGIKEVRLGVMADNDAAIRFYKRRGMKTFAVTLVGTIAID